MILLRAYDLIFILAYLRSQPAVEEKVFWWTMLVRWARQIS